MFRFLLLLLMFLSATDAAAQGAIPILSAVQGQAGETEYSVTLQLLGLMTVSYTHLTLPTKVEV